MCNDRSPSFLARHPFAARLLLGGLFLLCAGIFLFHEGAYLLSLQRASLLIQPEDAPFVRSLPVEDDERMNINQATAKDLEQVPDIGPKTAQKILALREERGGFCFIEELLDVSGVGEKRLAALKEAFFCPLPESEP